MSYTTMQVTSAIYRDRALFVDVDGQKVYVFESKATILMLGYAIYLLGDGVDPRWLREHGETIPADQEDGRSPIEANGMLITSDPVLYVLACEHWLAMNGTPEPENVPLPIPTRDQAIEMIRSGAVALGIE